MNKKLWEQLDEWKKEYTWVDLSYEVSPDTPHWDGFPDMSMNTMFDFDTTIFQVLILLGKLIDGKLKIIENNNLKRDI